MSGTKSVARFSRGEQVELAAVTALAGLFTALMVPIGLHSDDVGILQHARSQSYGELWTAPFMELFYRPVVVTLAKLGSDLGSGLIFLRAVQALLIAAGMVTAWLLLRPYTEPVGRALGLLILLASPLTFITVTPFAVGVSDTLVLLALLLSLALHRSVSCAGCEGRRSPGITQLLLASLTALALLSKESGLLVALFSGAAFCARRRWSGAVVQVGLALGYLLLRDQLVAAQPFAFESGLWTQMLAPAELSARFSESPHGYYLYNVASNFVSALIYLPVKGQLLLTPAIGLMTVACGLTTLVVVRHAVRTRGVRGLLLLAAGIGANALLGYMYVRSRIMFVSGGLLALWAGVALGQLWQRRERLAGLPGRAVVAAAALLWLAVWALALVRLRMQLAASL